MITSINPLTATAAELQTKLTDNSITSKQLVKLYLDQITRYDGYLKAVIATAPQEYLEKTAAGLDDERAKGKIRGPLHGIPILVKDNIATTPELGLPTTCGSLALVGSKPKKNATIIEQASAGAIILGKANLSVRTVNLTWRSQSGLTWSSGGRSGLGTDFANSGWSAVGGQTQSAYVRGGFRPDDSNGGHSNPGGSSSGSAVAVAAGLSPIAIGTDTMGSLIMPSDRSALFAMKPTLKIVPQYGIIPVSFEADSAGPMTKSVLDLARLLDVLVDPSKTTVPEGGYQSAVTGKWGNIRIGVVKPEEWLFPTRIVKYEQEASEQMLREWKSAYERLRTVVKIVKPVSLLSVDEASDNGTKNIWDAFDSTFGTLLEEYLQSVDECKIKTLEDLIKFNEDHDEQELPPGKFKR
ncbi:hypothetical protein EKO27_g4234 [Xylaria grammica]|uniref:Amidase domain-containing protein n=1 Tax=Xylaria grammica TaxID=363999 RepID=A0A439D8Z0_9PEZI|nr:hypothetical protein EKO27_g4234 [Xylaria grammica]